MGHKMREKSTLFVIGIMISCSPLMNIVVTGNSLENPSISSVESPDWWKAGAGATELLFLQKRNIADLAKEMISSEPADAQQAMLKINIMMRAGMNNEAIKTLKLLKRLCPNLDNHQISCIYYAATDKYGAWNIARATVEIFADNISELCLYNRLEAHFENSGWDVNSIDSWFANMPADKTGFWIKEHLRYNAKHGREKELLRRLSDEVKTHADDPNAVIRFLDAVIYAHDAGKSDWDVSWISETCRPNKASSTSDIADRLKTLNHWLPAAKLYGLAMDIPLTDAEVDHMGMMCQIPLPKETLKMQFAANVRENLAQCLLKTGETQESQQLMEEAAKIREKYNLGSNMSLAGVVQAQSGARVIEAQIREKEEQSRDDPEYWLDRAFYYRGRKEPDEEEKAYKKALELARPTPTPRGKAQPNVRDRVIRDYTTFLKNAKRDEEAVLLLTKELRDVPANLSSVQVSANILARDFERLIDPNEEVYWKWLSNRQKWEHTEEGLLQRMLKNANNMKPEECFAHAEKLAKDNPSRSKTLGCIMKGMILFQRSIPLLRYAVEHTDDNEIWESAVFCLLESYLDSGDWKRAEAIFPQAASRLSAGKISEWYGRISIVAAKSGAKEDAIRIWKKVANINLCEWDVIRGLAKAGLKKELVEYYENIQKSLPDSEAPGKVFEILAERRYSGS